jgi:hypothetical protein
MARFRNTSTTSAAVAVQNSFKRNICLVMSSIFLTPHFVQPLIDFVDEQLEGETFDADLVEPCLAFLQVSLSTTVLFDVRWGGGGGGGASSPPPPPPPPPHPAASPPRFS